MKAGQPSAWEIPPCTWHFHPGHKLWTQGQLSAPELRARKWVRSAVRGHPPGGGGTPPRQGNTESRLWSQLCRLPPGVPG